MDKPTLLDQQQQLVEFDYLAFTATVKISDEKTITIAAEKIRPHLSIQPNPLPKSYTIKTEKGGMMGTSDPVSLSVYPSDLEGVVSRKITHVQIQAGNLVKKIPLEQVICSEHFVTSLAQLQLTSSWIPGKAPSTPSLTVPGNSPQGAYQKLLDFLEARTAIERQSALKDMDAQTLTALAPLATQLQITPLSTLVSDKLNEFKLVHNNCLEFLEGALEHKLADQQKKALAFIRKQQLNKCLAEAVGKQLRRATEYLLENDDGTWYADSDFAAAKKAIALGDPDVAKLLLQTTHLKKIHQGQEQTMTELIQNAVDTGRPDILKLVLTAANTVWGKTWIQIDHKILARTEPDLWAAIHAVCPEMQKLWKPGEKPLLEEVCEQKRLPWIVKLIEVGNKETCTAFHLIRDANTLKALEKESFAPELLKVKKAGQTPLGTAMRVGSEKLAIAFLEMHKALKVKIDPKAFFHRHLMSATKWIADNGSEQQKDALLKWAIFLRNTPAPNIAYAMLQAGAKANPFILSKLLETNLYQMGATVYKMSGEEAKLNAMTSALDQEKWVWLRLFIDNGPWEAWSQPKTGRTLLHLVAEKGENELAKRLVELGANPYQPDLAGFTAFDIAKDKGVFDSPTCVIS